MFGLIHRGELPVVVESEFENLIMRLRRSWLTEHNADGTHNIESVEGMERWDPYTPIWTNLSVGNGTVIARYNKSGKTAKFVIRLFFGSSTTVSGALFVSLPIAAHGSLIGSASRIADCCYRDNSAPANYHGAGLMNATTTIALFDNGNPMSNTNVTVPFTWAVNDVLHVIGSYEISD